MTIQDVVKKANDLRVWSHGPYVEWADLMQILEALAEVGGQQS